MPPKNKCSNDSESNSAAKRCPRSPSHDITDLNFQRIHDQDDQNSSVPNELLQGSGWLFPLFSAGNAPNAQPPPLSSTPVGGLQLSNQSASNSTSQGLPLCMATFRNHMSNVVTCTQRSTVCTDQV